MNGKCIGAVLLIAFVLAPADSAFAHGGNGGSASDYRVEVTGFDGDATGVEVRSVELGNRMELVRTTAKEVQILGYEGEPYLRLDGDGVFENVNSPAHYINVDRFARQPVPATATAKATPDWVKLSSGSSIRWHDHRTHWMDPTPRADVRADPDVERVIIPANRVDLVIDGRTVAAIVRVTWVPPPHRTTWLLISSLLACALIAVFVLVRRARWWEYPLSVVAGVGVIVGSGSSSVRIMAGCVIVAVALVGWRLGNRWFTLAAGGTAAFFAVTHFEPFEHHLLAGWAPAVLQRVAVAVALACGASIVGSELVVGLGATQSTAPVMAET